MPIQTLQPLRVPWQIAASNDALCLMVQGQAEARVIFVALLGYESLAQDMQAGLVPYASAAYLGMAAKQAAFHQVEVSFQAVIAARAMPLQAAGVAGFAGFDKPAYDCSALASVSTDDKSPNVRAYDFKKYWNDNRRCPDPGAYIVANSEWLASSAANTASSRHYLFLGQHVVVEVLAAGLDWLLQKPVLYHR